MTTRQHPLLNSIILHFVFQQLPQKDLLLAQRVCKTWHDLIKRSQSLQKQLFLLPDHDHVAEVEEDFQFNGLLQEHFPEFFRNKLTGCDRALGPLRDTKWLKLVDPARVRDEPVEVSRLNDIYARPEASWRRMIPCRPAPRELQMLISVRGRFGASGAFKKLKFEKPHPHLPKFLTFGLMYDIVQYFVLPSYEKRMDMRAQVEIVVPAMRVPNEGLTLLQRYAAGSGPTNEDVRNEFWLSSH
ncbi:hypothetical protein HII31_05525 [Pseudocercospora fuligena]|uniref:F-box domain-containing protein n=1 Tax=Pseudocercospora fuligena TaxID=685502 RepID=A0A8H6RLG7_9PEZI|nr:hypothetical protein HII31_05525 [Pseudocercospora fuligena]